jgi:hypothetical protein
MPDNPDTANPTPIGSDPPPKTPFPPGAPPPPPPQPADDPADAEMQQIVETQGEEATGIVLPHDGAQGEL